MSEQDTIRLQTLAAAPLNAWIALSADESRILAAGTSLADVSEQLRALNEEGAFIMRTPPHWSHVAL